MDKVFCIFDSKIGAYQMPFHMPTVGAALRAWDEIVNDQSGRVGKHPEDYTLFEVATFDPESGRYEALPAPMSHGVAVEFVKENPQIPLRKNMQ